MRRPSSRLAAFALGLVGLATYALATAAQDSRSSVDAALKRLATLGKVEVKGWRWKHGDDLEGASPKLDDSNWAAVEVGHRWTGENTEGWYRQWVEPPTKVAGFDVAGTQVTIEIGLDDYGEIWIDGEKRGEVTWDKGSAVLTERLKPGERKLVALRARNRGGPGRLLAARLSFDGVADVERAVIEEREALSIAKKIVAVLGNDDAKWKDVLEKSASALDLGAADRGDRDALKASVARSKAELSSLKELTKRYSIRCAGYSHIDLAWLWRWIETVQVCKETFASAIHFTKEFPDFRFSMSQSHAYRWMEEREPELFAAIQKAVKDGSWEIVGGTAVELDCNLPDAESHVRQILAGQRYFQEKFGKRARIGWCPDSFGYNGNLPQILKKAGLDYFVTSKISWNDTNKFPHNLFWWEAPDGSRVLTFLPLGGYANELEGPDMIDYLKVVDGQTGYPEILMVYGVGNHGGGPTREMLEREERLAKLDFFPKIQKSTAIDYFDAIKPEQREKLPTWKDELYLEYHRGTYTTQAANKRANRKGEVGLVTAEKIGAVANLVGGAYPARALDRAWDFLLFNQMHDILPGSSITPVYRDSAEDYARMFAGIDAASEGALGEIGARVDLAKAGASAEREPVVVFNSLSWVRDDVATLELRDDETAPSFVVRDPVGAECVSQVVVDARGRRSLLFESKAMPSMGHRVYTVEPGGRPSASAASSRVRMGGANRSNTRSLANDWVKAEVDVVTGNVTSIEFTPMKREALAAPGNRIQLLEDKPKEYDAWELGFTGREWALDKAASVETVEQGPLRATIRVKKTFLGDTKAKRKPTEDFPSSFFTQEISVYSTLPWVETRLSADWWEDHVCAKVAFPLSVKPDKATYEIPYAVLERSTKRDTPWEKARYEVSAQKWADMSEGGFGVSILNESKYGYDALGNVLRLTALRAPTWPDPVADRGRHSFSYAIYPHAGTWRDGGTVRAAYQFNHPLVVARLPHRAAGAGAGADGAGAEHAALSTSFARAWGGTSFAPLAALGETGLLRVTDGGSTAPPPGVTRVEPAPVPPPERPALAGALPAEMSFVSIDAPNVIAPVVKRATDSNALIVRLYEWAGAPSTPVTITFPFEIQSASLVNLLEESPKPLAASGKRVTLELKPFAIETLRIEPKP